MLPSQRQNFIFRAAVSTANCKAGYSSLFLEFLISVSRSLNSAFVSRRSRPLPSDGLRTLTTGLPLGKKILHSICANFTPPSYYVLG